MLKLAGFTLVNIFFLKFNWGIWFGSPVVNIVLMLLFTLFWIFALLVVFEEFGAVMWILMNVALAILKLLKVPMIK